MSTPRDLMIVALAGVPGGPVEPGDLSLALAGAELIDLVDAEALTLAGDRIVPKPQPPISDRLLDEAAALLTRQPPYESVEEWLWRRGRDLSLAYASALEEEGQVIRQRGRWTPFRTGRTILADSAARRGAEARWVSEEPVLAALAAAAGLRDKAAANLPDTAEDAVTVVAAVHDAVMELEAVRRRRAIEEAAFDNVWRGA